MEEDACWVNGGERVLVCTNTATDRNGFSFGLVEEGGVNGAAYGFVRNWLVGVLTVKELRMEFGF